MSKKNNTIEVPKGVAIGLTCLALGGVLTTVGTSFADNLRNTSTVTSGDFVLPYDGFLMMDSTAINGPVQLKFELYESLAGVNVEWTETQTVNVYNGRFSVGLGSINSVNATILDAEKLWLAITVLEDDGMGGTVEVPLSGRQAIEPAPYATWAGNSANFDVAGDLAVTGDADVTGTATIGGPLVANGSVTLGDAITDRVDINGEVFAQAAISTPGQVSAGSAALTSFLTVGDNIRASFYHPDFATFNAFGNLTNGGGAQIVNDNASRNALVIRGNNRDPALSGYQIELLDDVEVGRDLRVAGQLNAGKFEPTYTSWTPSPSTGGRTSSTTTTTSRR